MNYLKRGEERENETKHLERVFHKSRKSFFLFFFFFFRVKSTLIGHSGVRNDVQEIPAVFESFAAIPSARAL